MPKDLEKLAKKDSTELIVYQLGEVKNILENMNIKVDNYQEKMEHRVGELERFKISQEAKQEAETRSKDTTPAIDVQKIILAAFSLISTIVAIALGINQAR